MKTINKDFFVDLTNKLNKDNAVKNLAKKASETTVKYETVKNDVVSILQLHIENNSNKEQSLELAKRYIQEVLKIDVSNTINSIETIETTNEQTTKQVKPGKSKQAAIIESKMENHNINKTNIYNDLLKFVNDLTVCTKQNTGKNLVKILYQNAKNEFIQFNSRREIKDFTKIESYDTIRDNCINSGKQLIEVYDKDSKFHIVHNGNYKGVNKDVMDFFPIAE